MTTNSLLLICQHHKDAWVSNGSHVVHYHESRYELWDDSGSFLESSCPEQTIQVLAESYEVDLQRGWFLVAHI